VTLRRRHRENQPSSNFQAEKSSGDVQVRSAPKGASWAVDRGIVACFSALAAERRQSQASLVASAGAAKHSCPKLAADAVKKGTWTPAKNGDPLVEESIKLRATFLSEGKSKGKNSILTKFPLVTNIVKNEILPAVKKNLGPSLEEEIECYQGAGLVGEVRPRNSKVQG